MSAAGRPIGIGMVGAGTMAGAHSAALLNLGHLYPELALQPRLAAVTDINAALADGLAARFGWTRVEPSAQALIESPDVDLVVAALPPGPNREVVLAAAAAGKAVVCEKPLGESTADAAAMLEACEAAGVFHGLAAGYRWSPALRAIADAIRQGDLGAIRSVRLSFLLDYAADPAVPLLWRFRKSAAGGGIAADTGYHLVDCARFLVGEIDAVQSLTRTFITERPLPAANAVGNRGAAADDRTATEPETGPVDVEDAAAALLSFENGAYGVLESSRVAIGRRLSLQIEVYGSIGSASWDLERPDEFGLCLPDEARRFGFRRILVNTAHPGAAPLLIAGTDGTSIGWLGQECAMWAEFLTAIDEGRRGSADFHDGVRDSAVIDALYAAASRDT
ncbi:MAG TPA: Gfo/Idh/MocA family oxidoreductase, partial [Candidatus Limnocylindrales bacterium]|nr:Gfo/Idh/MocA family oxidoreductase [Candidatus Limnocylindrales bacterium]